MNKEEIQFDDFRNILSKHFGQELNSKSEVAAKNFLENISAIEDGILKDQIKINVDIIALARSFPEYKRYQVWKGLSIIFFLTSLPVFLFSWEFSIGLIIGSIIFQFMGKIVRQNSGSKFVNDIKHAMINQDISAGIGNLCAQYIAGNIQLTSPSTSAHWPQYPSNIITGGLDFIE